CLSHSPAATQIYPLSLHDALPISFAQGHPMFANASVGLNVATLSPTYQLIMGMPGGSSAIEIAGRLGMNEELLDHAVRLVNTQRSEEHTSELQSRFDLVCRLLLEK